MHIKENSALVFFNIFFLSILSVIILCFILWDQLLALELYNSESYC